mmetsp:Transcript_84129/g.123043  ORF Transcript_84129/g.123043 Transcript_84129/m.123043 type:complete len:271 (+) Transcript_84129:212-1024(+)
MQQQQQQQQQQQIDVNYPKPRENMFGIGLKITDFFPHKVLSVNNLRDQDMNQINNQVSKGDILEYIDNTAVEQLNIDELEWHIFGPSSEMVTLSFFRPGSGHRYQARVKRHVPIQFALGMSVTRVSPYSVKRVDELLDPNNDNIGDLVEAGDLIEFVNGKNYATEKVRVLEDIIFGAIDSMCTIVLRSLRTGQSYEVTFKRHIPVSSWMRWEEQGGMHAAMAPPLRKSAPVVQNYMPPAPALEGVRRDPLSQFGSSLKGFEPEDVTGEFI